MSNNKVTEDAEGNKSSKRYAGFTLIIPGVLLKLSLAIFSFKWVAADPETIKGCSTSLIVTGLVALGLTIPEWFRTAYSGIKPVSTKEVVKK